MSAERCPKCERFVSSKDLVRLGGRAAYYDGGVFCDMNCLNDWRDKHEGSRKP